MAVQGMVALKRAAWLGCLFALGGCSGPSDAAPGAGGATTSSAGTYASGGSGGNAGAGGTGAAATGGATAQAGSSDTGGTEAGGSATAKKWGQVLVESLIPGAIGTHGVQLSVSFISGSTGTRTTCTTTSDGPCHVDVCGPDTSTVTNTYASAGTVSVTSPDLTGSATSAPDGAGNYSTPQITFPSALLGSEHLQVSASGGEVPAFQGDIEVPLVLLLSAPAYDKSQTMPTVPRSSDLALVWTRGVKDVVLWVQGYSEQDPKTGYASLLCAFPSETGTATIKSSLLQLLGADGRLNLLTINSKVVPAGDYAVTLGVAMPAANPTKDLIPQIHLN